MQKIKIKNLKVFGNHGVYKSEVKNGQYFYIDIVYAFKNSCSDFQLMPDNIDSVEDYTSIINFFQKEFNSTRYSLMEKLINDLIFRMNDKFNFYYIKLSITKKIDVDCDGITIEQEVYNE